MATNNTMNQAARQATKGQGLLNGLVLGAEHMMLLGCGSLLLVLVACGVITWYAITGWTTPTDPTPKQVIARPGEVEHWAYDNCQAGRTKFFTQNGMVCR